MIYQNEDVANESVVWVAMCSDIELRVQILCQNQFYTRYFMGYLDALIVKKLWFHFFLTGVVLRYCRGVYSQGKMKVGTWSFTLAHLRDPVVPNKKYKNISTLMCTKLEAFEVKYFGI